MQYHAQNRNESGKAFKTIGAKQVRDLDYFSKVNIVYGTNPYDISYIISQVGYPESSTTTHAQWIKFNYGQEWIFNNGMEEFVEKIEKRSNAEL